MDSQLTFGRHGPRAACPSILASGCAFSRVSVVDGRIRNRGQVVPVPGVRSAEIRSGHDETGCVPIPCDAGTLTLTRPPFVCCGSIASAGCTTGQVLPQVLYGGAGIGYHRQRSRGVGAVATRTGLHILQFLPIFVYGPNVNI